MQKVLDHFPGAEITAVRGTEPPADAAQAEMADADEAYIDQAYTEDDL